MRRRMMAALLALAALSGCAQSKPEGDVSGLADELLGSRGGGGASPPDVSSGDGEAAPPVRAVTLEEALRRLPPEQRAQLSRSIQRVKQMRARAADGGKEEEPSEAERLLELLRSGKVSGFVEGRILDAATGEPVAARVSVADRFGMVAGDVGGEFGFWADGRFRVRALVGRVVVSVSRGRRSVPWRTVLAVKPGETARVVARVGKPATLDFEARGWVGCDLRYSVGGARRAMPDPTLALAALAARAEGLGAVALVRPWRATAASYGKQDPAVAPGALTAKCRALSRAGTLVLWGYERTAAEPYGSLLGLGLSDWGRIDRHAGNLGFPNSLTCGEIRRQRGVAIYTNLANPEPIETAARTGELARYYRRVGIAYGRMASELVFDTVAGPLYDAVELSGSAADERVWFRLLSEGYRIAAVGATGGALEAGAAPSERTLLHVGQEHSEKAMLEAIRRGRSMVTMGPYAFLAIDGRGSGEVITATPGLHEARVEAYSAAEAGGGLAKVELVRNGRVVLTERAAAGQTQLTLKLPFRELATAWYVARVTDRKGRRAWANPVYFVRRGDAPPPPLHTRLMGTVVDEATGAPLAGTIRVYMPDGRVVATHDFKGGQFAVTVPAAAGVEVTSPGYGVERRLVFFASGADEQAKAIHTDASGRKAVELERAATYAAARQAAAAASVAIGLRRR